MSGKRAATAAAVGVVAWLAVVLAWAPQVARAAEGEDGATKFLRYEGDDQSGRLEAAIVTYKNAEAGTQVDLVSAVHVGDHQYFANLSKQFKGYDAVLYEMVKEAGMEPPRKGEESASGVSGVQRFVKNMLGLEFQLDEIDYRSPNFVHADLDAETFERMQDERGESIFGLMLQQMLDELTNPTAERTGRLADMSLPELLGILTSPDRPRQLKLLLAPEFGDIEGKLGVLAGPKGSVIVTERNKAAINTLKSQLAKGKKRLAIFYGAAHMQDMESRLKELGFEKAGQTWVTAWDIPAAKPVTTRPVLPKNEPTTKKSTGVRGTIRT